MLKLKVVSRGRIIAGDQSTRDILAKGNIGDEIDGDLLLSIEEALYLIDVRNAECTYNGKPVGFNGLAGKYWKAGKFAARYFTYRDWRDRGLVIKSPDSHYMEPEKPVAKAYPSSEIVIPEYKVHGTFFKSDLITIVDDAKLGRELYEALWFGQYGSYKAAERGQLNKLDVYETLFLMERGVLYLDNISRKDLVKHATTRRGDFPKLYEVYKDWRERGYVIKTGFKFGTHFRVYFPGARPIKEGSKEWVHSKHVIHVFPKDSTLLISEWARAIRVAHSVRKTFILAVPGEQDNKEVGLDFILYHRRGGDAEDPATDAPRSAMLSLGEEEYIGGREFAAALKSARAKKLDLILGIVDRETSVTYYKVRQIKLPGSKHEYYEIDWLQP